jgi:hypothetical protein
VIVYSLLKIAKFLAILVYVGGLSGAFVTRNAEWQRVLVHRVASPALLLVWGLGYALTGVIGTTLTELWVLGGLGLSLVSHAALVFSAAQGRQDRRTLAWATIPLVLTIVLMVTKPTWMGIFGG